MMINYQGHQRAISSQHNFLAREMNMRVVVWGAFQAFVVIVVAIGQACSR